MTSLAIETSMLSKYTRVRGIFKGLDEFGDSIYVDNYVLPVSLRLQDELEDLNPKKGDLMVLIWLGQEFALDSRFYLDANN